MTGLMWACMCILCNAEWLETYDEEKHPTGRCGRCGSHIGYWITDDPDE